MTTTYSAIVAAQVATSAALAARLPLYDWAGATRKSGVGDPSYSRADVLLWPARAPAPCTNAEALAGLRSGRYSAAIWSSSSGGYGHGPHRAGASVVTPDEVEDLVASAGGYYRAIGNFGGNEAAYTGYLVVVPGPYPWGREESERAGYGPHADNGFLSWAYAHGYTI